MTKQTPLEKPKKNRRLKDVYQEELDSLIGIKGKNKRIGILRKALRGLE